MNIALFSLTLCVAAVSQPLQAQTSDSPLWNTPGAGNPFIPGYFADPTIRKFGDTYYLYATTDGTGNGYGPAQVWVSKDFVNWRNYIMNWPTSEVVWAPDVIRAADGSFRYFYCQPCQLHEGKSHSPVGPWINVMGENDAVLVPDRFVHNAITLDGQTFVDDDGATYLYFGTWGIYKGFGCGVAKMGRDLKSFVDKKLIPNTEITDFFEAPYLFKRNGTYYFTYSSGSCHDESYRVQYAVSKTGPMGPYEYKGCILKTNDDKTVHGPGHHSILEKDGQYYIVYHRHNLPRSIHGFNRQVCIDEMIFDDEGNILPIIPTHNAQGVPFLIPQTTKQANDQTPNIAFGAKVTASSYYDEWFKPEYAVDDNNATLWKARHSNWGRGSHQDEWLQIDLGKVEKFNEIWTQFEYATFFYQYKIETSIDGSLWKLFADRSDNTLQGSPMIDKSQTSNLKPQTTKARYVRITISDTQKNGHMPAIWNVKIWKEAPVLPTVNVEGNDAYPGMHKKDVEAGERGQSLAAAVFIDAKEVAKGHQSSFDVTEVNTPSVMNFTANKPIRMRVKDGKWAFFFNGSQALISESPLSNVYCYNAPYTIAAWTLQTEASPVATIASLSSSRADLATTELRLGTDPQTGLINHNGSFESSGAKEAIEKSVGQWHHWVVTFDGWMERVYRDGQLLQEKNNFLMIRPEGHVVIGADATGTNNFRGYLSDLIIMPIASGEEEVTKMYERLKDEQLPSLGDDDFEESDPDSKFTLPTTMKLVFQQQEEQTLAGANAEFNINPLENGAKVIKELTGDFVVMARVNDMEGLKGHQVTAYNEGGLIICAPHQRDTVYYQLGAFPLYNCGNMLTILSRHGRPQFPNYKGYQFDPYMQFERRGNQLFARTSKDGQTWSNMPGSPIIVNVPTLGIGIFQTTYSSTASWVRLSDLMIYS